MSGPQRGLLYHFTHVENLPSIMEHGLLSDSAVRGDGSLQVEIGEDRIKAVRREREVPVPPGGVVADYVPFYFAPRSPMLYTINRGNVASYQDGQDPIVYLVTDCDELVAAGGCCVFTDRNAYYHYAAYSAEVDRIDELVDWSLMEARYWHNTATEPDRRERRMAELLVLDYVPPSALLSVAVRSRMMQARVEALLDRTGSDLPVVVRPEWYF